MQHEVVRRQTNRDRRRTGEAVLPRAVAPMTRSWCNRLFATVDFRIVTRAQPRKRSLFGRKQVFHMNPTKVPEGYGWRRALIIDFDVRHRRSGG